MNRDDELADFRAEVEREFAAITEILMQKRRAYGAGNLAEFGEFGILVRLSDKFARIKNLLQHPDTPTADESRLDTWRDVIGYAVLAIVLYAKKGQVDGSARDDR